MSSVPSTPEKGSNLISAYPSTPVGFGTAVVPNAFMLAGSPTAEQFQEERRQLVELNKKLKKILDAANKVNINLGSQVDSLKEHHLLLIKKTEGLEADLLKLMTNLEGARATDASLASHNIVLERRLLDLIDELKQLVVHLEDFSTTLSGKLHKKQTEFANLSKEVNDLESLIAQLEQKVLSLVNGRAQSITGMEAARLALAKAKVAKDHLDLDKSNFDKKNGQLKDALAAYGGRDVHEWYQDEHNIRVNEEMERVKKSFETELELTKRKIAAEFEASFSHSHQKWTIDQKRLAETNAAIVELEKSAAETRHTQSDLEAEKSRLKLELETKTIIIERLGAAITKTKDIETTRSRLAATKIKNHGEIDVLDKRIAELQARLGLSAEANQYVALTPEIERYQNLLELADYKISHTGRAPKMQKTG